MACCEALEIESVGRGGSEGERGTDVDHRERTNITEFRKWWEMIEMQALGRLETFCYVAKCAIS